MSTSDKALKKAAQPSKREKVGVERVSSYACREYGVTEKELTTYVKRVHGKIEEHQKAGELREFTGDIEALCEGHSHA